MHLIIDRGNHRVKWAIYDQRLCCITHAEKQLNQSKINSIIQSFSIRSVFISAVAKINFDINKIEIPVHVLSDKMKLPFNNKYETPSTLGRDRIAVLAGARSFLKNRNVLIIDTGTCLTYDVLTEHGEYNGGTISPGPELRYLAMNNYTAALPLVDRKEHFELIGNNTLEAVQNGGFASIVAEIMGWISWTEERFDNLAVVISGKDGVKLARYLKNDIFVCRNFVLFGLNEIRLLNE